MPMVETPQMLKWDEEHPDYHAKTIQGIPLDRFGDAKKMRAEPAYFWQVMTHPT